MKIKNILILSFIVFFTASCTSIQSSSNLYTASEVGANKVLEECIVVTSRIIKIRPKGAGDKGESIGAVAGGVGGSDSNILGVIAGGVLGGIAGRAIGDKLSTRPGVEYSVRLLNNDNTEQTVETTTSSLNGSKKSSSKSSRVVKGKKSSSLRSVVQYLEDGERLMSPGSKCILQVDSENNRVLPYF